MKPVFCLLFVVALITSCGSSQPKILSSGRNSVRSASDYTPFFDITDYSEAEDYGLAGDNPVKVGEKSVENQVRYLSTLAGPKGEELQFHRRGACCPYDSENGFMGSAMVDVYEVTYKGLKKPILVYISFYDYETLYIPKGFMKSAQL